MLLYYIIIVIILYLHSRKIEEKIEKAKQE